MDLWPVSGFVAADTVTSDELEVTLSEDRKAAAFFDLDRTLISGSSVYAFGYVAWRAKMVPTRDLLSDARKAIAFRLAGSTDDKANGVRDRILEAIEGRTVEQLAALGEDIIPRLLDDVRNESQGFIDLHHEAGRSSYLVTASPIEIVLRYRPSSTC